MDLSNLGIVYRVQGRRDEAIALFQRAYTIMSDALGPDDPKTLTVARNLSATQVIEVAVIESPRAPPAALAQRLSTPRGKAKTKEEAAESMAAATEKREAQLNARVEKATEMRTPRGGQSSNVDGDGAVDVTDGDSHNGTNGVPPFVPYDPNEPAPVPAASAAAPAAGPPAMPKLKLNLAPKTSSDDSSGGSATPRSTYSKASSDAKRAVQDSKSGKGSARSMLHNHVAKFDFSSAKSPTKTPSKAAAAKTPS